MKLLISGAKRLFFRDPELPPPLTLGYLIVAGFLLTGSVALISMSLLSYVNRGSSISPGYVTLGLATLVLSAAELLSPRWRAISAAFRATGVVLVFMTIWLFVR